MSYSLFDPFLPRPSYLHSFDPRGKVLFAFLWIILIALLPYGTWGSLILSYATLLVFGLVSQIGVMRLMRRSSIAIPFALAALPLVFTTNGIVWKTLAIGPWSLPMTIEGLERFIFLVLKSWISVQIAILLTATTPFPQILLAFRNFRIPKLLVAIIGLMWRYIFLFVEEALRMMHARDARSGAEKGKSSGGTLAWRARVTGGMAGSLLIRGFDRAEHVYSAMLARGYDGEIRSLPIPPIRRESVLLLLLGFGWLCLIFLFGWIH